MEEKINDVLDILDREESPSQREIAKKTGFSLGLVNILIKKAVKKGLLKVEKLNSRNIKYILTPEGIKEKTNKTIDYIKKSYHAVKKLEAKVKELALKHDKENKDIYVFNEREDEIFALIVNTLDNLEIDYLTIDNAELLIDVTESSVLYHWHSDLHVNEECVEAVNIFR
jgi:DNA-binding MarR family transcriptional regulator